MFILKDKCKNCLCVPNSQTSVCGWMPSFLGGVFFGVNQITELMRRSPLLLYNMLSLSQFSELSKKCYLETKPCSHRLGKSQMRRHLFPTTSCTFLFKIFACCCLKVSREDLSLAFQQSWHVLQKHWFEKAFQVESGKLRIQEQREQPSSEMWHSEAHHWQEPPRDALFPVHLHCKCGQRALVTYWPDSSSFRCQNVPCLLEKWTPAGCSPRLLLSGPGLGACFFFNHAVNHLSRKQAADVSRVPALGMWNRASTPPSETSSRRPAFALCHSNVRVLHIDLDWLNFNSRLPQPCYRTFCESHQAPSKCRNWCLVDGMKLFTSRTLCLLKLVLNVRETALLWSEEVTAYLAKLSSTVTG